MSCLTRRLVACVGALVVAFLSGCGSQQPQKTADRTCTGKVGHEQSIVVWSHSGTVAAEGVELRRQTAEFNASQNEVHVRLVFIPQAIYAHTVQQAAASGALPDVLEFDGPDLYYYAWAGLLRPIDSCIPARLRADLLPSLRAQGSYAGRTWGVGVFDSGLGLFIRPSILRQIGARIPQGPADVWSTSEFTTILHRLRAAGYRQPLDMKMNYVTPAEATPEWFTYGFSPIVWSAGGDLINRSTYRTADGVLNSTASIRALTIMQSWFREGLVNPDVNDQAFVRGEAPISWVGHWEYAAYHQAFPNDLKIVPLPRFGPLPSSGMGSWQWGITTSCNDGEACWRYLAFLLRPQQVRATTQVNGAVPGTYSAVRMSPNFEPGGPEHPYVELLTDGIARPRPQTPAYPAITAAFAGAILKITKGHGVRQALDAAVGQIDGNLAANQYYKTSEP